MYGGEWHTRYEHIAINCACLSASITFNATSNRLEESENENTSLRNEITSLRAAVAGKDRENVLYKEELATMSDLLAKYKDRVASAEGTHASTEKQSVNFKSCIKNQKYIKQELHVLSICKYGKIILLTSQIGG